MITGYIAAYHIPSLTSSKDRTRLNRHINNKMHGVLRHRIKGDRIFLLTSDNYITNIAEILNLLFRKHESYWYYYKEYFTTDLYPSQVNFPDHALLIPFIINHIVQQKLETIGV